MPFKFNPFTGRLDIVKPDQQIQVMQTALLNDFSQWTLTDVVINASNQLELDKI